MASEPFEFVCVDRKKRKLLNNIKYNFSMSFIQIKVIRKEI